MWTKGITANVEGGVLHGIIPGTSPGELQVTVKAMYTPGSKSVTLIVPYNAGNVATSRHEFELVDSAPPAFGPWYVDGVIAPDDVWIAANSATFRVKIVDKALPLEWIR